MMPVAWQVPGELLCERCAHGRWGNALYSQGFQAPGHEDETAVVYSWEVGSSECCTECGENLLEAAGYIVADFLNTDTEEEE